MVITHLVMFHFLLGASDSDAPPEPESTGQNIANWLAPGLHVCLAFGLWVCR